MNLPLAALKKRAKESALEKLIGVMRNLEAKEPEPMDSPKMEPEDHGDGPLEPDFVDQHEAQSAPPGEEDGGHDDFLKEREGFLLKGNRNPPQKGKGKFVMMAATVQKKPFSKKGY
jgi:hypothetical protein